MCNGKLSSYNFINIRKTWRLNHTDDKPPPSLLFLAVTHTKILRQAESCCMSVYVGGQNKLPKTTRFLIVRDARFSHRITKKKKNAS